MAGTGKRTQLRPSIFTYLPSIQLVHLKNRNGPDPLCRGTSQIDRWRAAECTAQEEMGPRMRPRSIMIRMKIAQFHGGVCVSVIKGKFGGIRWPSLNIPKPQQEAQIKESRKGGH